MGVSDNTETLRREVLLLRGELAQERARGEAARIAYEAELADMAGYATPPHAGDENVAAVIGPGWGWRRRLDERRIAAYWQRQQQQTAVAGLPCLLLGKAGVAWLATVVAGHPALHALLSTLPTPG